MTTRDRAWRRAQRWRMRTRAFRKLRERSRAEDREEMWRRARKDADHMRTCSCRLCSRRSFSGFPGMRDPTLGERRAERTLAEERAVVFCTPAPDDEQQDA